MMQNRDRIEKILRKYSGIKPIELHPSSKMILAGYYIAPPWFPRYTSNINLVINRRGYRERTNKIMKAAINKFKNQQS